MADLKRQLGLLDATMINVGTIIASAIFIVPSAIALQLHASLPAILVWIAGGLVSLLGALSVAELGAAMPQAGGQYVYLTEAYGPVWGYLYGWASGVVINPASIAAIAVGFATYFAFFVPLADAGIKAVAVASIVALTALNCLGVRLGAITQNVLTLIKMALLVVLIVAGFVLPGGSVAKIPDSRLFGGCSPKAMSCAAEAGSSCQLSFEIMSVPLALCSSRVGSARTLLSPNCESDGPRPRTAIRVGLLLPPSMKPPIMTLFPVRTKPRVLMLANCELTAGPLS